MHSADDNLKRVRNVSIYSMYSISGIRLVIYISSIYSKITENSIKNYYTIEQYYCTNKPSQFLICMINRRKTGYLLKLRF